MPSKIDEVLQTYRSDPLSALQCESKPEMPSDEFLAKSFDILNEGVQNHYSKEYVTDRLFHLAHANPNTAKSVEFPADPAAIKKKIVVPWYDCRSSNSPDPTPGPEGEFEIIVQDEGGRNGPTYGGALTVRRNDGGPAITVLASSWPDVGQPNPGIKEGTYQAVYRIDGHKNNTQPGVQINYDKEVPTIGPNPVHGGKKVADHVHIHRGAIAKRGSAGCPVVPPKKDVEVWNKLLHGTNGWVTIERK